MKQSLLPALVITACLAGTLLAQPPVVSYPAPAAVVPGASTDLTLFGTNMAGPTALWTNLPSAKIELAPGIEGNGTKADQVVYRCTLAAEAPVGVYAFRLATGKGVSNTRLLMVDDLASVADNGNNKSLATAQPLTFPTAVDGAAEAESYDFYKLTVPSGQRISVEVVARRLGSALDPVVRLLDAAGRELAYSDDEPGIGADCRFVYQAPTAGDYYLELRDIRYQGSPNHRYRLRIGNFPLVNTPFPLAGQKGTSPKLTAAGPSSDEVSPLSIAVPFDVASGRLPMAIKYAQGQGSAGLSLIASGGPEQVEFEPNDAPENATAVALPFSINGRFETPKDRDWFEFPAKKGQRFLFTGRTRSIGSPTDLFMRIYNAAGGVLVEAEDSGMDEGVLNFTFPEDANYRLMVEDLLHRGGPDQVYRIDITPYQPGFSLAVDAEKYDVPKGGVFVTKVTAVRRDYNGPITLTIDGIAGTAVANNVIPEGKNETTISVTVPPNLESGQLHPIRVIGQAKVGENEFRTAASTLVPLRTQLNGLPYPPSELDGSIGLGIGPVFAEFFQLSVEPSPVVFAQVAAAATLTVKTTKANGFDDNITLAVDGLPPGVTATAAPIPKGQAQVAIPLTGPGALAEGDYKFRIVGSATFQNQPRQVVLGDVVLRVVKPFEVSVSPAGPMNRGAAQKIKFSVARTAATGPVAIRLKHIPAGLNMPAEITIPEGQTEVQIDVTAAADMPLGECKVVAVATSKVKDKLVAVESAPVVLQVAMP
ncbi:MAG TPA: PPC domain-containing protein [Pirellulales bacterium]|nr:PPC domain-containing protein [Pirellulales bacterium]